MTNTRPYRPPMSAAVALETLRRDAGTHFDPAIVEAFARCLSRPLPALRSPVSSGKFA
jgi:HD-GYP domain-containing protein (c-di-GMP phosphodiesterase class II)